MNNNLALTYMGLDGYAIPSSPNSINSMWMDKRSAEIVSVSLVFYGTNAPTGTASLEFSNAPEADGSYGQPRTYNGVVTDAKILASTSVAITATGITQWNVSEAARWVRVVYVSNSDVSGLSCSIYANAPYSSPG